MRLVFIPLLLVGCDFAPRDTARAPSIFRPDETPVVTEPVVAQTLDETVYEYGTVHWSSLASDCDSEAWQYDETALVVIHGAALTLVLETTPELSGTIVGDHASVAGIQTWMGDDGYDVDCVVNGTAKVKDAAIEGVMEEALESEGALNCVSRASYSITYD